jgi:hypothetical protein
MVALQVYHDTIQKGGNGFQKLKAILFDFISNEFSVKNFSFCQCLYPNNLRPFPSNSRVFSDKPCPLSFQP